MTVPIPLPDPTSPVFFEQLWNFYAQPLKQKVIVNGARPSRTVIDLSKVSYGDNYIVTLPEWLKVPGQSYSEIPGPTVSRWFFWAVGVFFSASSRFSSSFFGGS
jgi:hypothetical protein